MSKAPSESTPDSPWRVSWDALEARAWSSLNRYGPIPPAVLQGMSFRHYPRLRLTSDPDGSEAEPTTLTVFELFTGTGDRSPVVRESVWRQSVDRDRVRAAVEQSGAVFLRPTVEERHSPVPREWLSYFLRDACAFRVPVAWPGTGASMTSGSCPRYRYEFFTRDQPPTVLRLEWWMQAPWEWQQIGEWYWRLRGFLVKCLDESESQG